MILIWPCADTTRHQRITQFTLPREGYKLNWDAFTRELNDSDRSQLPLHEYNRTRLYFDVRLVPLKVADLYKLCTDLDKDNPDFGNTYLDWFKRTHFYQLAAGIWNQANYNPARDVEDSKRATEAEAWYNSGITQNPVKLSKRIARILSALGLSADYEKELSSHYSTIKADIFCSPIPQNDKKIIIEMKAFSSENTMPSTIKEQIKITLRRHAQFAGFISRS